MLLDNWAEHVQAINANGLTVVEAGHEPVQVRIPAALPTDIKEVQDVIILFTKSIS